MGPAALTEEEDRPARVVAVVNPKAGVGMDKTRLMEIRQALHGESFGAVYVTLRPGDGEEWARTFRHKTAGYLVIGGDGTLHEVVSGMDLKRQGVAPVTAGTGNSFVRELGRPTLADAAAAVETARHRRVDVLAVAFRRADGTVRRCRSAVTIGIGYPREAVRIAEGWLKPLGALCYPLAATAAALWLPRIPMSVRYDAGRWERRALKGLLVNNTPHAGNFKAFPAASIADGKLDVMELSAGFLRQLLHNLSVLTGLHWYNPARVVQARRLDVKLDRPQWLMVDGELYRDVVRLDVRVLAGGLKVWTTAEGIG